MSHGIKQYDVVDATEPCWHGFEVLHKELDEETIRAVRTPVKEVNLPTHSDTYRELFVEVNGGLTLNVVKDSYGIIQASRSLEAIRNSLVGVDYKITCAGTLDNWKRYFFSIDIAPDQKYVTNRDEFKARLTLVSSHDTSYSHRLWDCITRAVCQNTINQALGEKGKLNFSIRHTRNAEVAIGNMEQIVESAFQKRDEFFLSLEYLESVELSSEEAAGFIAGMEYPSHEVGTRVKNRAREIARLYEQGAGNKGRTAYDLLNGYTEYFTHSANASDKVKNFQSSDFGSAANRKSSVYAALVSDQQRQDVIKKGQSILSLMK